MDGSRGSELGMPDTPKTYLSRGGLGAVHAGHRVAERDPLVERWVSQRDALYSKFASG
jgi:hypothetical protein